MAERWRERQKKKHQRQDVDRLAESLGLWLMREPDRMLIYDVDTGRELATYVFGSMRLYLAGKGQVESPGGGLKAAMRECRRVFPRQAPAREPAQS